MRFSSWMMSVGLLGLLALADAKAYQVSVPGGAAMLAAAAPAGAGQHKRDGAKDDEEGANEIVPQKIDPAKAPRLIMIIRHAEKPEKSLHSPDLTEVGRLRAQKIPGLFVGKDGRSAALPRPDFLFATAVSKNSRRPIETIEPLSAALGEKLNIDYSAREDIALARELLSGRYAGKVVLVCWHHSDIAGLAGDLGVKAPPQWMGEVFDQVWKIEFPGGAAAMTTAPEMLLPGDSDK